MFTKNKVIDRNNIQNAIKEKDAITYEKIKEDLGTIKEQIEEIDGKKFDGDDFNYCDLYVYYFSFLCLCDLSLDELEFINNNNLFKLEKDNLIDYKCQKTLEQTIENYKKTLEDLSKFLDSGNIGNYFQQFGDLFHQMTEGRKIKRIIGLDRNNIELTLVGINLKKCIDNIDEIWKSNLIQKNTSTNHNRLR